MVNSSWRVRFVALATAIAAIAPIRATMGHGGGILVQAQGAALVIGHDAEDGSGTTIGVRAFSALMPSTLAWDSPSFISFSTPPAGTQTLPSLVDVDWDFLPMTSGGVTSNLLYWDGQGTTPADVEFGPVPQAGVTMTLYGRNFEPATANGAAEMVRGKTINQTMAPEAALRLHAHRFFVLDDGDGSDATAPPTGIYLVALQLRTPGFITTDPFYIAFGIPGTSLTALDSAARPWVSQRVDSLILEGDYNFDGKVDLSDYAAWKAQIGSTGPYPANRTYADGNRDGIVDAADYVLWRDQEGNPSTAKAFGAISATLGSGTTAALPEPSSFLMFVCALAVGILYSSQQTQRRRK